MLIQLLSFFMRQILKLMRATFLIELTCQTSLNWDNAGGQQQIQEKKYTSNFLNNAVNLHNGKINFFKKLSNWLETWAQISDFYLANFQSFCCNFESAGDAYVRTFRGRIQIYFQP